LLPFENIRQWPYMVDGKDVEGYQVTDWSASIYGKKETETYSWLTPKTLPQPPNLSLAQP